MCLDYFILVSFSSLLSLFLEFCFREGNIFQFWLPMWAKVDLFIRGESMEGSYDELLDRAEWITKPLGACVVCFGFWVSAIVLIPFIGDPFVYIFGILLSSFFIRLFYGLLL